MPEAPRRALLVWEFGAGRTHAINLLEVGKRLVADGVQCLASLHETRFAPEFAAMGIPVVQAIVWPTRRFGETSWFERPVSAFSDVLGNLGFGDPETLSAAIRHYDALFDLFSPDIVLAENAFGAVAAARGRVPCIAFGTAACLPPEQGAGFVPRLDGPDALSWPLDALCADMNVALGRCERPKLSSVNALLGDIEILPYGPIAFDIYGRSRTAPMLPPNMPDLPRPVPLGEGERLFAYLHGQTQHYPKVVEGLVALGRSISLEHWIHMPGMTRANREALTGAGWQMTPGAMPLPEILTTARCVLHHGGTQLTTACLAAAIPQVLLPKELDNEIAAHFLAEQGLGLGRHLAKADDAWLVDAVLRVATDDIYRQRSRSRVETFRQWVAGDPGAIVAARALVRITEHRAISP